MYTDMEDVRSAALILAGEVTLSACELTSDHNKRGFEQNDELYFPLRTTSRTIFRLGSVLGTFETWVGHEHVVWLKLKSQIAKKRNELNLQHWQHVHHQVRTTAAASVFRVCFTN